MAAKTLEAARRYDFRRPDRFGRDNVRSLEGAHEVFSRRFSSQLSSALRAIVQIEPLATDQMSFDDYLRSMPNPTVVATATLAPLPGVVTLEMGTQLALVLVDRLLGGTLGAAGPLAVRRPTDLEGYLVRDVMTHGIGALVEAITPLVPVNGELAGLEYNPQLVQATAPSDTVLLLTYRIVLAGSTSAEGILTVGYPSAAVTPLIERIHTLQPHDALALGEGDRARLDEQLNEVAVEVNARLRSCAIAARDVATLRVGDVLRTDHRAGEPVRVGIDDVQIGTAHIGRRGRRLALQVATLAPPGATDN